MKFNHALQLQRYRQALPGLGIGGFTLTEIIICLALITVLMLTSIPSLAPVFARHTLEKSVQDYRQAINFARAKAVTNGNTVTLCASDDGRHCQGQWSQGFIIFNDANSDHQFDETSALLRHYTGRPELSIQFRSFGNHQYLHFTPKGFTRFQNGNFNICPASMNPRHAQQIIISRTARTRLAQDNDADGIREDSQGRPLRCP